MANNSLVTSGTHSSVDVTTGRQKKYWIEIQLVDEQGDPVANMPWSAESHHPVSGRADKFTYGGQSDADGHIRIDMPHGLELLFTVETMPLLQEMEKRRLRVGRNALQDSTVRPEAEANGLVWHYAVVGELCQSSPNLELRPGETLPLFHFPARSAFKGFKFRTNELEKRHVIEICPFRAWELVLHHQHDYSITNAINLGLISDLAYDEVDSVTEFFLSHCQDLSKLPLRKVGTSYVNALVCDIPFSDRYFPPVGLDSAKVDNPEGDTQLFYVYNNDKIIVGWRGTASATDGITDLSFRPVKGDICDTKIRCSELTPVGKVHTGFLKGYDLIGKIFSNELRKIEDFSADKKLFLCGHSLGGALALIHSATLKRKLPLLYTYGMPRTFTKDAVEHLSDVIHFRHVNDQDPVPSVPPEANVDNLFYNIWGPMGTIFGGVWSMVELAAWQLAEWGDCFWHHGEPVVFLTTTQSRKWKQCGIEYPYPRNCMTIRKILPLRVKLYLVPSILERKIMEAGCEQKKFKQSLTQYDMKEFFPEGTNPDRGLAINLPHHFMKSYVTYINNKLLEIISAKGLGNGRVFIEHADNVKAFRKQMLDANAEIPEYEFGRNNVFLELDDLLEMALQPTDSISSYRVALERFAHYGEEGIENVS